MLSLYHMHHWTLSRVITRSLMIKGYPCMPSNAICLGLKIDEGFYWGDVYAATICVGIRVN